MPVDYRLLILFILLLLPACSARNAAMVYTVEEGLELEDTPFFAQEKYQCGPASLAMLLGASGVKVDADALAPHTYLPERGGSLQLELMAAARKYDRIPYVIRPDMNSLLAELRAGRPVLVLQNLGLKSMPAYHYAVVIGIHPEDSIILRSGTTRRLVEDSLYFLMSWEKAEAWGLIALRPGELPAHPDEKAYLEAVGAFEAAGNHLSAAQGYRAALAAWPENQNALFAMGNNNLLQGKYDEAELWYRQLLQINAGHVPAMNNLAESLARRGCRAQSLAVIKKAAALVEKSSSPLREAVMQTLQEIRAIPDTVESVQKICTGKE